MMVLDIAIVTSVWGDYGKYIPRWLDSIERQTVQPRAIAVLDAGVDDINIIHDLRINHPDFRYQRELYRGMGHARNDAVALGGDTEWVMHLDVDDTLLSTTLSDVARVATDRVDVISIGAQRNGKAVMFRPSAQAALRGQQVAFSCGVYRRSLWKQRPYITTNDYVDSALWIGFAHLGARFTSIPRPGFVYQQHEGSRSKTWTPQERQAAKSQMMRLCKRWSIE